MVKLCIARAFAFLDLDFRMSGKNLELLGCGGSDSTSGHVIIDSVRITAFRGRVVQALR